MMPPFDTSSPPPPVIRQLVNWNRPQDNTEMLGNTTDPPVRMNPHREARIEMPGAPASTKEFPFRQHPSNWMKVGRLTERLPAMTHTW